MSDKSRTTPEADLAFLKAIVQGGDNPKATLTLGVAYLAGIAVWAPMPVPHRPGGGLGALAGTGQSGLRDRDHDGLSDRADLGRPGGSQSGTAGPIVTRTLNAAFSGAGMANLAIIVVFGFGAARDKDFAIWLYYPAMIFALQAAAWFVAYSLKKKPWMLMASIGAWITAVALGLLVREPVAYLYVCTAALFVLFAGPGWIMTRDALQKRAVETDAD